MQSGVDDSRRNPPAGRQGFATSRAGPVALEQVADRRRRLLLWLAAATALVMVTAGSIAFVRGPWLRVAEVLVVGNEVVPTVLVQEQANVLGESLLFLDTTDIAERVAAHPRIEQAAVERVWPQRVQVTVVERQPWAVWSQAGASYLVDGQGYLLAEARPSDGHGTAPGLWPIKGLDPTTLSEGARVDPGAMRLAQRLAEAVPEKLGVPVQSFEYLERAGLVVVTSRGRARFDTEDDFDYKLAVWQAVLAEAAKQRQTVNHVDLRFGKRPFFR